MKHCVCYVMIFALGVLPFTGWSNTGLTKDLKSNPTARWATSTIQGILYEDLDENKVYDYTDVLLPDIGVEAFQDKHGLAVDGIAGKNTRTKLAEEYKKAKGSGSSNADGELSFQYTFTADSLKCDQVESGSVSINLSNIEINLTDDDGNPVPGEKYEVEMSNGKKVKGNLDDGGYAKVTVIEEGENIVSFPNRPGVSWKQ